MAEEFCYLIKDNSSILVVIDSHAGFEIMEALVRIPRIPQAPYGLHPYISSELAIKVHLPP